VRNVENEEEKAELLAGRIKEVVKSVKGTQVRSPLRERRGPTMPPLTARGYLRQWCPSGID